ncbi:glycosyltransferase family 9 protein [Trabulsiella odontotermitis]|uniref:Glycosyltransferase n=1 Tax=Trabulsiella odontotermitis TaxID=379893 RepID=A0A0L0GT24_9ENTR|nr:glycosyltransferase family 9 protein [Trabulsiella odontotermitis]KNC92107.1 glycosyltransferase [Trabulsiella odontotermitis]
MINWLREINRSRNLFLKKQKLNLRLKLTCILTSKRNAKFSNQSSVSRHIVFPFIGKGIGDGIVIGGIINSLTKNNYKVSIVADKRTHFLFAHHPGVENAFLYDKKSPHDTYEKLKACNPITFVDSHEITHSSADTFNIIRFAKPAHTIGFNNGYSIYDRVVKLSNPLGHVSTRYVDLLNHLDIEVNSAYDYCVFIPDQNKAEALEFLANTKGKRIVSFVPYGSVIERFFSEEQITTILSHLSNLNKHIHIVIIGEQHKIQHIPNSDNITKNTLTSFLTAAQIINESSVIISPDTSIVHLSRAFNKRIICVYPFKTLSNGANNSIAWGANHKLATQINLMERRIMDSDINLIIKYIDAEIKKALMDSL